LKSLKIEKNDYFYVTSRIKGKKSRQKSSFDEKSNIMPKKKIEVNQG